MQGMLVCPVPVGAPAADFVHASVGLVRSVTLDPYASARSIAIAGGAGIVARTTADGAERPTAEYWRRHEAVRRFFWLCTRCNVANANIDRRCHKCLDLKESILPTAPTEEIQTLMTQTQGHSIGRSMVRSRQPVCPSPLAVRRC
jgi:hypothetical protein